MVRKKNLKTVTLLGIDCVNIERLIRAADICQSGCDFADVKLLTSLPSKDSRVIQIENIDTIEKYSRFVISRLNEFVDTSHVLVIQDDGHILNPHAWTDAFLKYDFIGAPWPTSYTHVNSDIMIVGNGGFSLRSKKLVSICATMEQLNFFPYYHPEDAIICRYSRPLLQNLGINFAPENVAKIFSFEENNRVGKKWNGQFGFHGRHTDISKWTGINSDSLAEIYSRYSGEAFGDKGTVHSYIPVYEKILKPYRKTAKVVLEIGILEGSSLRMWEEYFDTEEVHGVDITDQAYGLDLRPMIAEGCHKITLMDACNSEAIEARFKDVIFDVIIEDASHALDDQLQIYKNFRNRMVPDGIYIIEDVADIDTNRHLFENIDSERRVQILDRRKIKNRFDDVLIIIGDK